MVKATVTTILPQHDFDRLLVQRVPLAVDSQRFQMSGKWVQRVETQYLDGGHEVRTPNITEESDMSDAVKAKTANIADFGRIKIATEKLAQQMRQYSTANPPSPEQLATFIRSYQNILRWRDGVLDQLNAAAGQIDAVQGMLERWLD
jgi:hypothetical protein